MAKGSAQQVGTLEDERQRITGDPTESLVVSERSSENLRLVTLGFIGCSNFFSHDSLTIRVQIQARDHY
jgi:hypothetical protein